MVFDRLEAFGRIGIRVAAVRCGLDGLASPPCLLADLGVISACGHVKVKAICTILYIGTEPYVIATKPTITLKT